MATTSLVPYKNAAKGVGRQIVSDIRNSQAVVKGRIEDLNVKGRIEDSLVYGASSAATAFVVARLLGMDSSLATKIAGVSLLGGVVSRVVLMDRTANK